MSRTPIRRLTASLALAALALIVPPAMALAGLALRQRSRRNLPRN